MPDVRLTPLGGGLNDGVAPQAIAPSEAAATQRIDFNQGGVRSVDEGFVKLSRYPPSRASLRFGVQSATVHAPVFIPHHPAYNALTGNWSVGIRIAIDTDPAADNDRQALFTVGGPNTVNDRLQFFVKRVAGRNRLGYSRNGGAEQVDGTKVIWKRRTFVVVLRWNGANGQIVVDGSQVFSGTSAAFPFGDHAALYVGGRQTDSATAVLPFRGRIEEVSLWSAAISDTAISLTDLVSPSAANLVGLWRFHDGIDHRVEDLSPIKNDGYLGGGVIATHKRDGISKGAVWTDGEETALEAAIEDFDGYGEWSRNWKQGFHRWSYGIGFVLGRLPGTAQETVIADLKTTVFAGGASNKFGRLSLTAAGNVRGEIQDGSAGLAAWNSSNTIAPDGRRHFVRLARTGETTCALIVDGVTTAGPALANTSIPSGIVVVRPPNRLRVGGAMNTESGAVDSATMLGVDEIRWEMDSVDTGFERKIRDEEILRSLGPETVIVTRHAKGVTQGSGPLILTTAAKNLLVIDGDTVEVPVDQDLNGDPDGFGVQNKVYQIASVDGGQTFLTLGAIYCGFDSTPGARFSSFVGLWSLEDTELDRRQVNGIPDITNPSFTFIASTLDVAADRGRLGVPLKFVQSHASQPKPPALFAPRWAEGLFPVPRTPLDSLDGFEKADGSKFPIVGAWSGMRRFDDRWRRDTPFDRKLFPSHRSVAFEQALDRVGVARSGSRLALSTGSNESLEAYVRLNAVEGNQTLWCLADPEDPLLVNAHVFVTSKGELVLKWASSGAARTFTTIPKAIDAGAFVHVLMRKIGTGITFKVAGRELTTTDSGGGTLPWSPGSAQLLLGNCPSAHLADGGRLNGLVATPRFSTGDPYGAGNIAPPTAPLGVAGGTDEVWPFDEGEDVFLRGLSGSPLPGEILSPPYVPLVEGLGRPEDSVPNGVAYSDVWFHTNGIGPMAFFDGKRFGEVGILPPVSKLRLQKKSIPAWRGDAAFLPYTAAPDAKKLNYAMRFEGRTHLAIGKDGTYSLKLAHERDQNTADPDVVTAISFKGWFRPTRIDGRRTLVALRDGLNSVGLQVSILDGRIEMRWFDTKQKIYVQRATDVVFTEDLWHYVAFYYRFGKPTGADPDGGGGGAAYTAPGFFVFDSGSIPGGATLPARDAVTLSQGTIGDDGGGGNNADSPPSHDFTFLTLCGDGMEGAAPDVQPYLGYVREFYFHIDRGNDAGGQNVVVLDSFSGAMKELSKKRGEWQNHATVGASDVDGIFRFNEGQGPTVANANTAANLPADAIYTYRSPLPVVNGTYRFVSRFRDQEDLTTSAPSPIATLIVPRTAAGDQEAANWIEVSGLPTSEDLYRTKLEVLLYRTGVDASTFQLFAAQTQAIDEKLAMVSNETELAALFPADVDRVLDVTRARPPRAKFLTVGEERLYATGIRDVRGAQFTNAFRPQDGWDPTNLFSTESEDGSPETGLGHTFGRLVIFKRDSAFEVSLLGSDFGSLRRIDGEGGCVAHRSIVNVRGTLYFLGESGIYRIANAIEFLGQKTDAPVGTWGTVDRDALPLASGALWLDRRTYMTLLRRQGERHNRLQLGMNLRWPHMPYRSSDGPELTCIAAVDDVLERPRLLATTAYGLVVRLGDGEIDGARDGQGYLPLDGLKVGPAATTTSVPITGGTLATIGNGHYGAPVLIGGVRSVVLSNSAATIELDPDLPLSAAPPTGVDVIVGGFERLWASAILQGPFSDKIWPHFEARFRQDPGFLEVIFRPDFGSHPDEPPIQVDLTKGFTDQPYAIPPGARRAKVLQVILRRVGIRKPFEVYELGLERVVNLGQR